VSCTWKTKNEYTYSILGIEIPEIKTYTHDYNDDINICLKLHNNILCIYDEYKSQYYIFDLYQGKMKYPNIDITFSNFIFSQLFGIIFGIFINKFLE
jgi:hypothetical protein